MDRSTRQRVSHLLLPAIAALAVVLVAIWLGSLEGSRPPEAQRRSVRYSVDPAYLLAELDARLKTLDDGWPAASTLEAYHAAGDLREGLRSLLRSATDDVPGASASYVAPQAEKLVRELEAEYAQRNAALVRSLSPQERETLLSGARNLEAQLSECMRVLRRDGKTSAQPLLDSFRTAYQAWKGGIAGMIPPPSPSP